MPGKERHHKYVHKFVNGSTAVLFLFDTVKRITFENVEKWINDIEKCDIPIRILVGNKIDIAMTKKNLINPVSKTEALNMAMKYGMEYFETCSVGEASIV